MDELLYLEPDEEITSVIDKLKSLPGSSVALVLPKNASLAASVVNLKLLKREATKLRKTVAIVTQDKIGTSLASQVGIPVYAAVGDDEPVITPKRPKPAQDDVIELDDESTQSGAEPASDETDDGAIPVHRYDASGGHSSVRAADPEPVETAHSATSPSAESTARRPRPSGPRIQLRRGPVLTLLGFLIVGAFAWLFIVYPRATVSLDVATDPVHETATVTVDNNIQSNNAETGSVSGQKVQVETTVKQSFDTTGSKEVGTKAVGTVTINNRLGEQVPVPKGSTLARDSVTFVTTEETSVSAATVSLDASGNVLVKPGTKQVKVEAAAVGSNANVTPGDFVITSFSGAKRDRVNASNAAAFTGGESHTVRVVTGDDIENAKKSIGDKTHAQLTGEVQGKARDLTILANTIEVQVIDAAANKAADEEADSFELEAKVRARTIGFAANDYQQMVVALVSKTVPEGKELVVTNQDSVETSVESTDYDHGLLKLKSIFSTEMAQKVDQVALRNLIRGKTAFEAEQLLRDLPGIQSARVALRPSFKSHVPTNDSQIRIELGR